MATAGSMREAVRALSSTFSAATVPSQLPDELQQTIDAFLERYHDIEDHDSQRFHEDLLALYMRHVAGNPEKHGPFLSALRRVRPALTGEARLEEWWGRVVKPTIDGAGHKRHEIEEARALLLDILAYDADEDRNGEHARVSKHFMKILLDAYLARTKVPSSAGDFVSPEDDFVAQELETILVSFGRKKPKDFFLALDHLFVQRQCRIQTLNLLSAFVRLQPPHLYVVLETSLIDHLEKCLLIDASGTVIDLALLILIMLLPHITASLTSDHHLAKLFLIYSRILCWDKFGTSREANSGNVSSSELEDHSAEEEAEYDQHWEKLEPSLEYQDSPPPSVLHYFTFLYGLFPLNFMSFLRKPRKYLKSQRFPGADDFDLDQDLIHSRTEPYRRVHLLHPNMFSTTIEDELTENRWFKADAADIVTECMDLCMAVSTTLEDPGPPPTSALPALPVPPVPDAEPTETTADDDGNAAHDSTVSWRNTQSTMFAPSATDPPESFDVPPPPKSVMSSGSVSPLLKSLDVMDSPTLPPVNEDNRQDLGVSLLTPKHPEAPPYNLGSFAQNVTTGSGTTKQPEPQNLSMAALQREIMLLRNDLNFERYLKQQHLTHIGQLQRKHIKEATDAAETQNLINANRTLKNRLAKANELYAQLKKETLTSRSQSKKWEQELSTRVKSYREEEKLWHSNEVDIRFELKKSQQDCEHLKRMVEKAEAEQLRAEQRCRALEFELEDYGNVRRELEAVQEKVLGFQDRDKELHALLQERNNIRNDLEVANMRLNSRELERERSIRAYERRIAELESRLQAAERNQGASGQLSPSVQQMLDSALAASNAKLQQMKKTHYRLLEQHTELQIKYQDLEGEVQAEQGRFRGQEKYSYRAGDRDSRNLSIRPNYPYEYKINPPISVVDTDDHYDYYGDYDSRSPVSVNTPPPTAPPTTRPVRLESLHSKRAVATNVGFGQDFSAAYDATLNAHFQASNASDTKSALSVDTNSSKGDKKDKVAPKSEVRVYGRGGAQNIGKKPKEKEERKEREREEKQKKQAQKTGGFRGLKGIM